MFPLFSFTLPPLDPVAVMVGPLVIRWYALAYLAGFLLGWRYALHLVRTQSFRPNIQDIDELLTWIVAGVILGGRVGYVLFYQPQLYSQDPWEALRLWHGGMSFHGGLIGTTLAMILFSYVKRIYVFAVSDVVACVTPIGLFFGRLANFVNNELWGRVTDVPWGVIFPGERAGSLPRHPSQLYEAVLEGLVLLALLGWLARKPAIRSRPGILTGVFLIGYGIARIIVEHFREPDAQLGYFFGGVTMGQILSLPMVLLGLCVVIYTVRRYKSA